MSRQDKTLTGGKMGFCESKVLWHWVGNLHGPVWLVWTLVGGLLLVILSLGLGICMNTATVEHFPWRSSRARLV